VSLYVLRSSLILNSALHNFSIPLHPKIERPLRAFFSHPCPTKCVFERSTRSLTHQTFFPSPLLHLFPPRPLPHPHQTPRLPNPTKVHSPWTLIKTTYHIPNASTGCPRGARLYSLSLYPPSYTRFPTLPLSPVRPLRMDARHRQPLTPLFLYPHPPRNPRRLFLWSHREAPPLLTSCSMTTRSRIIRVHVRCRSTVRKLLQPIRGGRPSSNRVRLWRLTYTPLHRYPSRLHHPFFPSVAGQLRVHLGYPLHCHLTVVGNFAPHIHGQHLPHVRRIRLCIPLRNRTSFTQLKYVTLLLYFF
jgi:hypothetical protein